MKNKCFVVVVKAKSGYTEQSRPMSKSLAKSLVKLTKAGSISSKFKIKPYKKGKC